MSVFGFGRGLFGSSFILDAFELIVTFLETLDATGRVNDFLLARKERVAQRANFHLDLGLR